MQTMPGIPFHVHLFCEAIANNVGMYKQRRISIIQGFVYQLFTSSAFASCIKYSQPKHACIVTASSKHENCADGIQSFSKSLGLGSPIPSSVMAKRQSLSGKQGPMMTCENMV